jgi:hypothetical protein
MGAKAALPIENPGLFLKPILIGMHLFLERQGDSLFG